jgi:hypothetical protein
MTIETGCPSSLAGLHEACLALQAGTCTSALVTGTNLIFAPSMTITMSQNGVHSPEGICRTFDANANGYGRGEAINAIYVKPLRLAIRMGIPSVLLYGRRGPTLTAARPISRVRVQRHRRRLFGVHMYARESSSLGTPHCLNVMGRRPSRGIRSRRWLLPRSLGGMVFGWERYDPLLTSM